VTRQLVLAGSGVRSGKSAYAIAFTKRLCERRVFVANAQALHNEMEARTRAHRAERAVARVPDLGR